MAENKETVVKIDECGTLHIAEDVVASIISLAAAETEGVAALAGAAGIPDVNGKKSHVKGIRLSLDGQTVGAEIAVLVRYGQPVVQVCSRIQQAVTSAVETMTGLTAGKINVHVVGISFDAEKKQ